MSHYYSAPPATTEPYGRSRSPPRDAYAERPRDYISHDPRSAPPAHYPPPPPHYPPHYPPSHHHAPAYPPRDYPPRDYPPREHRSHEPRAHKPPPPRNPEDLVNTTSIFVGNLPFTIRDRDLDRIFGRYGRLEDVKMGMDKKTGRPHGYAFITFIHRRDAEECMRDLQGADISGRRVHLDWDVGYTRKHPRPSEGSSSVSSSSSSSRRYEPYSSSSSSDRRRSPRRSRSRSPSYRSSHSSSSYRRSRSPERRSERSSYPPSAEAAGSAPAHQPHTGVDLEESAASAPSQQFENNGADFRDRFAEDPSRN